MYRYAILVYFSNHDDSYIAEVPELPGCIAKGSSYEEAIVNVRPVMGEWIKNTKALNREIPRPQGRLKVGI